MKKDTKKAMPVATEGSSPTTAPELSDDMLQQWAEHTKQSDDSPATQTVESDKAPETDVIEADNKPKADTTDDPLNDAKTDAAVDDIIKEEGDAVLAAEDKAKQAANTPEPKRGFWGAIGHFFAAWWHNKIARAMTIMVVVLAIAGVAAFPQSRYFVLNTVGVRSSSTVIVMDNGTRLPLKNVTVSIGSKQAKTNSQGVAKIEGIKLGKQQLTIKRIAFATVTQPVTIGWGSNPLGQFILNATGARYVINVTDFVSGKPVIDAEATSGDEIAAKADKDGKITLTLDQTDATTIDVAVSGKNYRTDSFTLHVDTTKPVGVSLVPARKTIFVSKQSGNYDVVSMYLDGKDRKTILAGTGYENNNVSLVTSPDGISAALVSTRDNVRDNDGYRLSTLTIIPSETAAPITVTHAEQVQLIDWNDTRLIYVEASAGASAANPQRYKLMAYDYQANRRVTLATANQFNGIVSMKGQIYYAVSSTDPGIHAQFYRIKSDGTGRQVVFNQEVWTVLRTSYDTVALQTPNGWYAYRADTTAQQSSPPPAFQSRGYVEAASNNSLWVDNRDGLGTLISLATNTGKETVLKAQNGLTYPVRMLDSHTVIYRVANNQEVADYAIDITGGAVKKIADVSGTYGFTY